MAELEIEMIEQQMRVMFHLLEKVVSELPTASIRIEIDEETLLDECCNLTIEQDANLLTRRYVFTLSTNRETHRVPVEVELLPPRAVDR